ncbi:MAG: hypothetical protein Q8L23_08335 [Caulobacter sp.]|nr:hypothetical protein [Caulobacter sp.]
MRCFYHQDAEAIGLCKLCSRGLCPACATETDDSLACKNRHEAQVEQITMLIKRNAEVNGRSGAFQAAMLLVYGAGALAFTAFSIRAFMQGGEEIGTGFISLLPAGVLGICAAANLKWLLVRRTPAKPPTA